MVFMSDFIRIVRHALFLSAAAAIVCSGCFVSDTPEQTVKSYVKKLSDGKCKSAYSMVSDFAKEYNPSYSSFEEYKKSVCDKAEMRYVKFRVFRIDNIFSDDEKAMVEFRVQYDSRAFARNMEKHMRYDLRKSGRKWKIDGPDLEM